MVNLRKALTIGFILTVLLQFATFTANKTFGQSYEDFKIVNITVRSSADTSFIYPGSNRVNLKIETFYQNSTAAALSVVAWLETADERIGFSSGSGACSPARLLNGSVAEEVNLGTYITFEYLLDLSRSLPPNAYYLTLNITYTKDATFTYEVHKDEVKIEVSPYPKISLRVVDAYFSPTSYPGSIDTNLYMVLENNCSSTITSANFNLSLPANFTVKNPRSSAGLANRGDRFTATFTGISIPVNAQLGLYDAVVYADFGARTEDGVTYNSSALISVPVRVEIPPPEQPIMLASVNTLYNGASAPLLPSAKDVALRVYLINRLPDAISAMAVNVKLPNGINLRTVSGTYINGMTAGGTCFIELTVDVSSSLSAGRYYGELNLTYLRMVSGSSFLMNQALRFPINVESFHSYVSDLTLVTAYWGSPDPTPVYSSSRYVPLTIRLANEGRYAVQEVVVTAYPSPQSLLRPIKDSEACSTTLANEGSCTAVLYFDINTTALNIPVTVIATYTFTEFGTHVKLVRQFTASLPIESYPASESILSLVSAGWQNNVNVFPKTSNATYEVTLANRAPFSISGVNLTLILPEGMTSKGLETAKAYYDGPIRSLATFTASFTISVNNIPPRSYNATLTSDCIVLSGGPGIRHIENFVLQINVNDDTSALELVDSKWYEGSVGPNTYGAHLIILVRNVYVDGLRGAILEAELPKGIYNSADNSSRVKAAPLSMQLPQQLQTQSIAEFLSAFLNAQQASPTQVYSRGDILTFMVSLNLLEVDVGNYTIHGQLSYIDTWGSNREISMKIPISILGRIRYIEIYMDRNVNVRSRYINTSLTLVNHGSAPAYDAYVIVSSYQGTPVLIASPAVNYVDKINPGENRQIPLTLAYNPLGFYSQAGGASLITYGPVPFMVSVLYRDVSGYSHTFNNSITVTVEPFIELSIKNIRATGTSISSTVTGIIVNYGSSTARCVETELKIGKSSQTSFIGDIDPGSEIAFRVDINQYDSTAVLALKYYNMFNEQEVKEMSININLQEQVTPTPTETEKWPVESWIIVAGVIIFLAASTIMIYRMMKKSKLPSNPQV